MTKRRRVILQMTPLLDLLLVVIFAQYMDLQNTSRRMLRQEVFWRSAVGWPGGRRCAGSATSWTSANWPRASATAPWRG